MFILACKPEPKTVTDNFRGVIRNAQGDSISIGGMLNEKKIPVHKDGSFSVNITPDSANYYYVSFKGQHFRMFVLKDTRLTVSAEANDILNTLKFEGTGAAENNFLATVEREQLALGKALPDDADESYISKATDTLVEKLVRKLDVSDVSTTAKKIIKERLEKYKGALVHTLDKRYIDKGLTGKPSPLFSYEDLQGKTVNLTDFRGKYVYIDLWASWCEICLMDMPYLNQLKNELSGKNIAFISISIDEQKDKAKWKKAMAREHMNGIQLIADKAKQSSFIKEYGIRGIPRYILIDPQGNVMDANAKRPGEPELAVQLERLLK
jgi:thiol-disulfide isomerase/thioredoxin